MGINTNEILRKYNIKLTKTLGQNFLTDVNILRKIVSTAEVCKNDIIFEIGPGIGALTYQLALHAKKVIAVEIDRHLIPALKEVLNGFDNVEIINKDVLKADIENILPKKKASLKAVANLPYYITTPIIMRLFESVITFSKMVFMMQKEVALRLTAKPGTKEYGALSVAVQYFSIPKLNFTVSKHCFIPKPDVDSAVVTLDTRKEPLVEIINKELFFKIVRASFSKRRKTLLNSLGNAKIPGITKDILKSVLKKASIDENVRAEMLDFRQFALLANLITQKKS